MRRGSRNRGWVVYWKRREPKSLMTDHGSVHYDTKTRALESGKQHDMYWQYAEVRKCGKYEAIAEFGNPRCYEMETWTVWRAAVSEVEEKGTVQ